MQQTWIQRQNHPHCLLFFAGWGMDATPFAGIAANTADFCLIHDYRELASLDLAPFAAYDQVHLLAWSMGVWVAAHLLAAQQEAFTTRTAIGGTLSPIDGQRGIPPESYNAMLEDFGPQTLTDFYRNMFDDDEQLHRFLAHRPQRDIEALRREMEAFRAASQAAGPAIDIYTHKIITSRDRIFSGRNQMRAWGKGQGTVCNWPHFPFYLLSDWRDLLAV